MTRAPRIRPVHEARCPAPALLPAVAMPAGLALAMLVLSLNGRIVMDPRLAGAILLGWGLVLALAVTLARPASALGPVTVMIALALPFAPLEAALLAGGMALLLLAAWEHERPAGPVLPGGAMALAFHGVILLLGGCLLLLSG